MGEYETKDTAKANQEDLVSNDLAETFFYAGGRNSSIYSAHNAIEEGTNFYQGLTGRNIYDKEDDTADYPLFSRLPFLPVNLINPVNRINKTYTLDSIFRKYKEGLGIIQEDYGSWKVSQKKLNEKYTGERLHEDKLSFAYLKPDSAIANEINSGYYFTKSDFEQFGHLYIGQQMANVDFSVEGIEELNQINVTVSSDNIITSGKAQNRIYLPKSNGQLLAGYYNNLDVAEDLALEIESYKKRNWNEKKINSRLYYLVNALTKLEIHYLAFQRSLADYYIENMIAYLSATYPHHNMSEFEFIDTMQNFNAIIKQSMVTALDGTFAYGFVKKGGAKLIQSTATVLSKARHIGKLKYLFSASGGPISFLFMMACDYTLSALVDSFYGSDGKQEKIQLHQEINRFSLNVRSLILNGFERSIPMDLFNEFKENILAQAGVEGNERLKPNAISTIIKGIESSTEVLKFQTNQNQNGGDYRLTTSLLQAWMTENKDKSEISDTIDTVKDYSERLSKISELTMQVRMAENYLENRIKGAKFKEITKSEAKGLLGKLNLPLNHFSKANLNYYGKHLDYYLLGMLVWYNEADQLAFLPDNEFDSRYEQINESLTKFFDVVNSRDEINLPRLDIMTSLTAFTQSVGLHWISKRDLLSSFGMNENQEISLEMLSGKSSKPMDIVMEVDEFEFFKSMLAFYNDLNQRRIKGVEELKTFMPNGKIKVSVTLNLGQLTVRKKWEDASLFGNTEVQIAVSEVSANTAPTKVENDVVIPQEWLKYKGDINDNSIITENPLPFDSRLPIWETKIDGKKYWHWSFYEKFARVKKNDIPFWKEIKKFRRNNKIVVNDEERKINGEYDKKSDFVVIPPEEVFDSKNSGYYIVGEELEVLAPLILNKEISINNRKLELNLDRILEFNQIDSSNSHTSTLTFETLKKSKKRLYIPYFEQNLVQKNKLLTEKIQTHQQERDKQIAVQNKHIEKRELLVELNHEAGKYIESAHQLYSVKMLKRKLDISEIFRITNYAPISDETLIKVTLNAWEAMLSQGTATGIDATTLYGSIKAGGSEVIRKLIKHKTWTSFKPTFSPRLEYVFYENGAHSLKVLPFAYRVSCDFMLNTLISNVSKSMFGVKGRHAKIHKQKLDYALALRQALDNGAKDISEQIEQSLTDFGKEMDAVNSESSVDEIQGLINLIKQQNELFHANLKDVHFADQDYLRQFLELWAMENANEYYNGHSEITREIWDDALGIIYDQNIRVMAYELIDSDALPFFWKVRLTKAVYSNNADDLLKVMRALSYLSYSLTDASIVEGGILDILNQGAFHEFGSMEFSSVLGYAMANNKDLNLPLVKINTAENPNVKSSYELAMRPFYYINQLQLLGHQIGFQSLSSGSFIPDSILIGSPLGSNFLKVKEEQEIMRIIYLVNAQKIKSEADLVNCLGNVFKSEERVSRANFSPSMRVANRENRFQLKASNENTNDTNLFDLDMLKSALIKRKNKLMYVEESHKVDYHDMLTSDSQFWQTDVNRGVLEATLNIQPIKTNVDEKRMVVKFEEAVCYLKLEYRNKVTGETMGMTEIWWQENF